MAFTPTHKAIIIEGVPLDVFYREDSLENPIRQAIDSDGNSEEFEMVQPHVGEDFAYAKVKDADGAIVIVRMMGLALIDTSDIEQFQVGMPNILDKFAIPELQVDGSNLESVDLNIPFISTDNYCIVIDTRTLLRNTFESMQDEYKKKAVKLVAEYYGKDLSIEEASQYALASVNRVEIGAPYFPLRPGQNIRAKVCLPRTLFDSLPDITFDKIAVSQLHTNWLAISLGASSFKKDIKRLTTILGDYNSSVVMFSGTVLNLNFGDLAHKLRRFSSEFNSMLIANNISLGNLTPDAKFEFGFDSETFRLGYILIYDPYGEFLRVRMNVLSANMDAKLAKLLISRDEIIDAASAGMGWMDFLSEFFAGDYEIRFTSIGSLANSTRKGMSDLEASFNLKKDRFDAVAFKNPIDQLEFNKTLKDDSFKLAASALLLNARDRIGDNLLINLPNIIANVNDLGSLYTMIFDKISIKDLVDILTKAVTAELSLPDFNEIKIRGIIKKLDFDTSSRVIFDTLDIEQFRGFMLKLCEIYKLKSDTIDNLLAVLMPAMGKFPLLYLLSIDEDGNLQGLIKDTYVGDLNEKLRSLDVNLDGEFPCVSFAMKIATGGITAKDLFQPASAASILCEFLTTGIPKVENPCALLNPINLIRLPNLNIDELQRGDGAAAELDYDPFEFDSFSLEEIKMYIFKALKDMDKGLVKKAVQEFIKDLFAADPGIYFKFLKVPKIRMEVDKLALTKDELLKHVPGLDITTEFKKSDVSFRLPKIKDVNPSFDFTKFVMPTFDIFQLAIKTIEVAIVKGIELALVSVFKGILKNVVKALKSAASDLRAPDFGGLSLADLLDATDGFSMDNFADLVLPMINSAASRASGESLILPAKGTGNPNSMTPPDFDFTSFPDPPTGTVPLDFQYSGFSEAGGSTSSDTGTATASELREALDDMSDALKPLELLQIAKGAFDREDFKIMTAAIKNPKMKLLLTENVFNDIMRTVADYADINMIMEIQNMYSSSEVITALCDSAGIDYGDAPGELGSLRDALISKFPDLPLTGDDPFGTGTGTGTGGSPDDDDDVPVDSIEKIIKDAVGEAKEGLIDAIGSMKDDFNESLPFDEDPCSFMPKPADIPALDFANNMVFDTTFDSVKKQYKKEATTFPDMMIMPADSKSYVPLYYLDGDKVPIDYEVDPDSGAFEIIYTKVTNKDGVLNRAFGDHYHGENTPIYVFDASKEKYIEGEDLNEFVTKNKFGDYEWDLQSWGILDTAPKFEGAGIEAPYLPNVYVKNTQPELAPIPEVKEFLQKVQFHYTLQYTSSAGEDGDPLYGIGHYQVNFPNDNLNLTFDENGNVYTEFPTLKSASPDPECALTAFDTFVPDTPIDAIGTFQDRVKTLLLQDYSHTAGYYYYLDIENIVNLNGKMREAMMADPLLHSDEDLYNAHNDVIYVARNRDHEVRKFGTPDTSPGEMTGPAQQQVEISDQNYDTAVQNLTGAEFEWTINMHSGDTKSSYHRMTKVLFDKLARQFSKSKYFNIADMQLFIFDSDEIDLLKSDEAKNAAKDEFNEKCTFREEDKDKLKETCVKRLLTLTMRLYMIEMVVRGCFVFGHILPKEYGMNEALFKFFFSNMVQDLKDVSSTYFTTFKASFKKEHGYELLTSEEPLVANPKVRILCAGMFNDIMADATKIFPTAKDNFFDVFFPSEESGANQDSLELYTNTTIDLPGTAHEILLNLKANLINNTGIDKLPFMIQRVYIVENANGDIVRSFLYDDYEGMQYRLYGSRPIINPITGVTTTPFRDYGGLEPILKYRLCHIDYAHHSLVEKIHGNINTDYHWREFAYFLNAEKGDYDDQITFPIETADETIYQNPEGWARKYFQNDWTRLHAVHIDSDLVKVPILNDKDEDRSWTNYDYNYRYGKVLIPRRRNLDDDSYGYLQTGIMRAYRSHVIILPLEQILHDPLGIEGASGWQEAKKYFWDKFFTEKLNLDKYYVLFLMGIITKTATEKPDVKHAFAESKLVLKRAIEALSLPQETFDHVDKDNEKLDDMSEISTDPDNSNVSKKLSAGTANLMLKGDAEKFDPNIRVAKKIRAEARKHGINMTPGLSSQLARPWNYMPRKKDLADEFDPGWPVLRLGRKYLKSGYLEPKERKEIHEIKSGKNTNDMLLGTPDYTLEEIGVDPIASDQFIDYAGIMKVRDKITSTTDILSDLYDTYISMINDLNSKTWVTQADGGNKVPHYDDPAIGDDKWFPAMTHLDQDMENKWHNKTLKFCQAVNHPGNLSNGNYLVGNIMVRIDHTNYDPGIANVISNAKSYYCNRNYTPSSHSQFNFEAIGHPDPNLRHEWNMNDYLLALNWMHQSFWYSAPSTGSGWSHYGGTTSFANTLRVMFECLKISAENYHSNIGTTKWTDHDETFDRFLLKDGFTPSRAMLIDLWCYWKVFLRISNAAYIKICNAVSHQPKSIADGYRSIGADFTPNLVRPNCPDTDAEYGSLQKLADDVYNEEYGRLGFAEVKEWTKAECDSQGEAYAGSFVGMRLESYLKGELQTQEMYTADNPDSTIVEGGFPQIYKELRSIQVITKPNRNACGIVDMFCMDPASGHADNGGQESMKMEWDGVLSTLWNKLQELEAGATEYTKEVAGSVDQAQEELEEDEAVNPTAPADWLPDTSKTDRQNMKALGLIAIAFNGGGTSSSTRHFAEEQVRGHWHFAGIRKMRQFNIHEKNGNLRWYYPKNDDNGNYERH